MATKKTKWLLLRASFDNYRQSTSETRYLIVSRDVSKFFDIIKKQGTDKYVWAVQYNDGGMMVQVCQIGKFRHEIRKQRDMEKSLVIVDKLKELVIDVMKMDL